MSLDPGLAPPPGTVPVEPSEPGRAWAGALVFLVALLAVPALFGAAAWAVVTTVTGDDEEAAPTPSTMPVEPVPTVAAPGSVTFTPGGAPSFPTPGGPGPAAEATPPPGWPAELVPPPDATITAAVANGPTLVMTWTSQAEVGALADQLAAQLGAAGFTLSNELRNPDGTTASLQGQSPQRSAVVSVRTSDAGEQPARIVSVILNDKPG